tara:strand:- start:539 stop:1435 length:897 start_codon:yes stop_codon:yes gene_type:complete
MGTINKYPVYIVSKGRWENPLTAKFFIKDNVKFKIVVEPEEYNNYCKALGKENVLKLPFSNLGQGSMPARNWIWKHAIDNGSEKHWIFDDNIQMIRRLNKGRRIPCNALKAIKVLEEFTDRYKNIAITGFNYVMFVTNTTKKPFYLNCHVYSAMLIKNNMPYRWRLKYNEDVDLCLQVLDNKLCTVLFNSFMVHKTSTTAKMKGGNQTDLYKNNAYEKKVLKARSLEEVWPQYSKTKIRFNRPHHFVDWKKHFKHKLIRRTDIDWDEIENKKYDIKLTKKDTIKSQSLKKFYQENKDA